MTRAGTKPGTKPGTLLDYGRRIDRVIAHIGAHLDDPLDLDRLAEVACFSPYHFHRIYRSMTGETAAETLRRLRLHRAAGHLVQGKRETALIARQAGYGSVAAFTRAFAQAYGITPAAYRQRGWLALPPAHPRHQEGTMHDVTIRELPPVRITGFDHIGPYMAIGTAFDRLSAWAAGRGLMGPGVRSFAAYLDDPSAVAPEKLRSFAGLLLDRPVEETDGVRSLDIRGGRYAVMLHKGPYAELEKAYQRLYGEWLPESGETPADAPCIEEYLNDPRGLPPEEWLTEIRVPLT
ncbi:AraC family transcriptional regulator [Azospirillum thermophilum]|uniref:AraC family transcriptional regulator n=1 Tax=Azospirillum thermophilum TaxID=2202148 RepID=A0A2S2CTK3_9PROT|nr:AraC family transcriptional regulator [Azospirillum thermophilum]AWK87808.1 AraC family transcriptional regulator [Azospirillum thermophilum]